MAICENCGGPDGRHTYECWLKLQPQVLKAAMQDTGAAQGFVIDNKNGFVAVFTENTLAISQPLNPHEWPIK